MMIEAYSYDGTSGVGDEIWLLIKERKELGSS
jgi:hypothetical protein